MNKWMILLVLLAGCQGGEQAKKIDIQGHRGARGLVPENSIPAFILAAEMGVGTLELDVVISRDKQVVVSHEPFFSADICLTGNGDVIQEDSIINMYHLNYDEIDNFDCGSIGHSRFPNQKKVSAHKPLLHDVIDTISSISSQNQSGRLRYNIEIKSRYDTDDIFHPNPQEFSDLVYKVIAEKGIIDQTTIQSFDFRVLRYFKKRYPHVALVLLIDNQEDWSVNIDSLGFMPKVYSPNYRLLSRAIVEQLQDVGMLVIPWTINDPDEMEQLIDWGVDGIITDYPDLALRTIKNHE